MSGKAPPKGPRALRGGPPPPPSSIAGPSSNASGPSLVAHPTKKIPTGPRSLVNGNAAHAGRISKPPYRNGTLEARGTGINGGINGVGTKSVHSSTSSTNADTWIPNGAVNGVKTVNSPPVPGILGSNRAAISFSMPRRPSGSGPPPPNHPPPPPPQPTKSPPPPPPPSSTPPPPPPPATPPPPPPSIDPPPPPPPNESAPPPPPPEVPPPPSAVPPPPTSTPPPKTIPSSENIASSSSRVPPPPSPVRRPPSPPTARPVSPVPPSPSPPHVPHFTPITLPQRVASPSPQPPSDILSPSSPREVTPPPPPPSPPPPPPTRRRPAPPVLYSLPPLPNWPPHKSEYPSVRSYKVLHDPSIHKLPFPSNVNDLVGYSSDGPPTAPGASSSTALTPPYFQHLVSCMPEYVSASVFQDRVKGKGKGKEIVYRYEGEVSNRGEWIPVPGHGDLWIREPEIPEKPPDPRLNSNVKRRPPRGELGYVTYEYEQGISTTPPPPTALLLTNLSPLTSNTQLRTHLGGYGPIKVFEPKIDKENGMALGVVWVDFRTHEDAKRCFDGICGPGLDIRGIGGSLKTLLGASAEDVKVIFDGQGKRVAAVIKELEDRKRKRKEATRKTAATKDTTPLPAVPTPKQNGTPRPNASTPSGNNKPVYHPLPSNPRLSHALPANPTKQHGPAVGSSSLALHNPLKASPMRPTMANGASGPAIPQLQKAREAAAAEMKHEKEKTTEKEEGMGKRRMMDSFKAKPRERLRREERDSEGLGSDGHRNGQDRYDDRYRGRRQRSPSPNPLQYLHKGYTEDEVEKALLTNGKEYIIVEFEDGKRTGGGVSEGEVRDFFEDFSTEKVMSAPKHGLVFVTFMDPEAARRALISFAGTSLRLAYRNVKLRPGEKGVFHGFDGRRRTVWEDAEMVDEAARLLVAELKQILTKDVKDRVVGNEVKRLMRAGVKEKEDDGEKEKGAKTLDLKGLSFRKRRREGEEGGRESKRAKVVDEWVDVRLDDDAEPMKAKRLRDTDEAEEEEEERPKKKGKIERKVPKKTKGKKGRVVVEDEEEDVVVVVNGRKAPNFRSVSTLSPSTSRSSSPCSVPPTPALVVESESESEEEVVEEEEEDLGVFQDDEDRFFAKIALSHPEKDFESLEDNLKAELGIPPPPVTTPRLRIHATGSARTEGYYEISHAQKAEYVSQYQARSSAASSKVVVDPAPNDSPSKAGVTSSRENRANARRRAQGLEEMNQLNRAVALSKSTAHMNSKDNPAQEMLLKFNQLQSRKKHLRFARSPIHDWGLYAMERISRGEMVIEYVGEIVRAQVAEKREKAYERQGIGSSYLFRIDEDLVVDATKKGNLGRLINHSCDPNCTAKIITISGEKKIVIYAKQDIELGDEITYDYHFPFEQDKIPCLCGSAKCRGFLN